MTHINDSKLTIFNKDAYWWWNKILGRHYSCKFLYNNTTKAFFFIACQEELDSYNVICSFINYTFMSFNLILIVIWNIEKTSSKKGRWIVEARDCVKNSSDRKYSIKHSFDKAKVYHRSSKHHTCKINILPYSTFPWYHFYFHIYITTRF